MTPRRADGPIPANLSRWLDLFRGGAAIAVLFAHAEAMIFVPGAPPSDGLLGLVTRAIHLISRGGAVAVIAFFVLSGYLVGGRHLVRSQHGRARSDDYVAARASRMWTVVLPALLLTLGLDSVALFFLDGQAFIDARAYFFPGRDRLQDFLGAGDFACNALFVQTLWCRQYGSNLSLWSISNEAFYYAIWWGLVLGLRHRLALLVPLALLVFIVASALLVGDPQRAVAYLVYLGIWVGGALIFAIGRVSQVWVAAVGCAALLLFARWHGETLLTHALIAVVFGSLLKILELRGTWFPAWRLPTMAAEISFSLYAIHLPVLVVMVGAAGVVAPVRSSAWFAVGLYGIVSVGCILVASVFWLAFERQTKTVRTWVYRTLRRADAIRGGRRPDSRR